jgi:hypothetical protein
MQNSEEEMGEVSVDERAYIRGGRGSTSCSREALKNGTPKRSGSWILLESTGG